MAEEKENKQPVSLVEVPTQFGLAYSTPEGNMSQEEYLVWLGNKILNVQEAIVG